MSWSIITRTHPCLVLLCCVGRRLCISLTPTLTLEWASLRLPTFKCSFGSFFLLVSTIWIRKLDPWGLSLKGWPVVSEGVQRKYQRRSTFQGTRNEAIERPRDIGLEKYLEPSWKFGWSLLIKAFFHLIYSWLTSAPFEVLTCNVCPAKRPLNWHSDSESLKIVPKR